MDISWLAEHGPCKGFKLGDTVPCPGGTDEAGRAMYILLVGTVEVYKSNAAGGLEKVATLMSGDVFGGREYFANATEYKYVSSGSVVVYMITEESFNDLSWSRPDILFDILRAAYLPLRITPAATPIVAAPPVAPAPPAPMPPPLAPAPTPPRLPPPAPVQALAPAPPPPPAPPPVAEPQKPKAKAAATEKKPATTEKASKATEKSAKTTTPPASKSATPSSGGVPATIAIEGSIFPEGHKLYSDFTVDMNMQLVFPKDYTCPFCKVSFNDFRVFRSKLYESQPTRYDLRKYYRGFVTEWYDVIICRNCLFTTFHNYFTDPKPIKKANIENDLIAVRAEIPLDFDAERDINYVLTSHYLALLCAGGYPSMDKQIRGKLWGNLSWLYEDLGDVAMEKYAAAKAAEVYEQVYTEARLTPVQEQITCLSIAGMQHRAGIDNNMKRFLFNAKTNQMGDKNFAKLAEDFMFELKIDDDE